MGNSFDDTAYELGRLLRIAVDLADPVILGAGRRDLQRVAPELYRYVDLNLTKFPLVHDGALSSPLGGASIGRLLVEVTSATSASVGPLSKAFWRDGRIVSARSFDFRSVPYAETSLNYSRGVTAASYLWLSAWAKANGDFTGYRFAPNSRGGFASLRFIAHSMQIPPRVHRQPRPTGHNLSAILSPSKDGSQPTTRPPRIPPSS